MFFCFEILGRYAPYDVLGGLLHEFLYIFLGFATGALAVVVCYYVVYILYGPFVYGFSFAPRILRHGLMCGFLAYRDFIYVI